MSRLGLLLIAALASAPLSEDPPFDPGPRPDPDPDPEPRPPRGGVRRELEDDPMESALSFPIPTLSADEVLAQETARLAREEEVRAFWAEQDRRRAEEKREKEEEAAKKAKEERQAVFTRRRREADQAAERVRAKKVADEEKKARKRAKNASAGI